MAGGGDWEARLRLCACVCSPRDCVCPCVTTACIPVCMYVSCYPYHLLLCEVSVRSCDRWHLGVCTAGDLSVSMGQECTHLGWGLNLWLVCSEHLISTQFLFVCMTSLWWDMQWDESMQGCVHSVRGPLGSPIHAKLYSVPRRAAAMAGRTTSPPWAGG